MEGSCKRILFFLRKIIEDQVILILLFLFGSLYQLILLLPSGVFLKMAVLPRFFFAFLSSDLNHENRLQFLKSGGSLTYLHMPVLGNKRIILVNDSQLAKSGCTV